MIAITPRQEEVLGWIVDYISDRGYSPSIREIGEGLDIGSLRGVTVHLDALERKGYIRRDPSVPRGLAVLKRPRPCKTMKNKLNIKVVTDGTPRGTKLIDTETGQEITDRILSVNLQIDPSQPENVTVISILGVPWETVERKVLGCEDGVHKWERIPNSDQASRCSVCGKVSGK